MLWEGTNKNYMEAGVHVCQRMGLLVLTQQYMQYKDQASAGHTGIVCQLSVMY